MLLYMSENSQKIILKHYGISPWEINVITSILDKKFFVEYDEIENNFEDKFVSLIEIPFLYPFNEDFFKWFYIEHNAYNCKIIKKSEIDENIKKSY